MLIGVPASGKTYLRKTLRGMVLSTDDYVHEYAEAEGKTYSEVFKVAMKAAESKLNDDLLYATEKDLDIIWDQTNLTAKSRAKKLEKIPSNYRKVAIFVTCPPEDEWYRRIRARTNQTIPMGIIKSMAASSQFPTKSEGFDDILVIDDKGEYVPWH